MMNDRYLMHYGVKGMKWGVRKEEIRSKRASLVMNAPQKTLGNRRSTSSAPTKGYWRNAPESQIRRMVENDHKMLIKSANKHSNQIKKLKSYEHSQLNKVNSETDKKQIRDTFYKKRLEVGRSFINDVNKTSVDPYKDFYSNEFRDSLSKTGKNYIDALLVDSTENVQYLKMKK